MYLLDQVTANNSKLLLALKHEAAHRSEIAEGGIVVDGKRGSSLGELACGLKNKRRRIAAVNVYLDDPTTLQKLTGYAWIREQCKGVL